MHKLQVRRGQQALRQIATPVEVRRATQIEAREMQQVEAHQHHGGLAARRLDLRGSLQLRAVLQRVERGAPGGVERDDLTVEDQLAGGLRGELLGKLRKE